jgi:hypothetical protein
MTTQEKQVVDLLKAIETGAAEPVGENQISTAWQAGRRVGGRTIATAIALQSTKFDFVINLQAARALGIEVPPGLLSSRTR